MGKSKKRLIKRVTSVALIAAMAVTSLPAGVIQVKAAPKWEPDILCKLTFEGTEPFDAGAAKAEAFGNPEIVDRDGGGKALRLDGGAKYVALTKKDGSSLLTGFEEFTISYDINVTGTGANWAYFVSRDAKPPTGYKEEYYLGGLYNNGNMTVERYLQKRNESTKSSVAECAVNSGWNHYDVVVRDNSTSIYENGILKTSSESPTKISEILLDKSIFYIGKATWGSGEYCVADIDNFVVSVGVPGGLVEEPDKLCELTFDKSDAFDAGAAKAVTAGAIEIVDVSDGNGYADGKAVRLGQDKYISITKDDDTSLLKGLEEFTISYDINNLRTGTNWAFFASRTADAPAYDKENYLGCLYSNGNMSVERYLEGRNNAAKSSVIGSASASGWHHYDVVVREGWTHILEDGELKATSKSPSKVSEILLDESIFYIGKATWGSGEYCEAQMDNFVIYNGIPSVVEGAIVNGVRMSVDVDSEIMEDIELPPQKDGVNITWKSSDKSVISDEGVVIQGDEDASLTLMATFSLGDSGISAYRTYNVTVPKAGAVDWEKYLIANYEFEENTVNGCDASGNDKAQAYTQSYSSEYNDDIVYEDGVSGQAVRVGNYGLKLNKKNIGKNFTVSLWTKPDGTSVTNEVLLFLGYNNPEKWIGISGEQTGTNKMKVWGKGDNLDTWTTLFSPVVKSDGWHNIVLVGSDGKLVMYYDGEKFGEDNRNNNPLFGANQDISIAVNHWDAHYRGLVDNVKIYNRGIPGEYIKEEYDSTIDAYYPLAVDRVIAGLKLPEDELVEDIELPTNVNGVVISWETSNASVITSDGKITRGEDVSAAALTATVSYGGVSRTKEFTVKVAKIDAQYDVNLALPELNLPTLYTSTDMMLPDTGLYDTTVTWSSSDKNILGDDGKLGAGRPESGAGDANIVLTATVSKEGASATKTFNVTVMEKPYGYIAGYVRGNNDRTGSLHIAYSKDGSEYTALNGNSGILFAKNDTSNDNKRLSTGIRFTGAGFFRNTDGTFGVIAPQGRNTANLYVYTSSDLLSFDDGRLVEPGDEKYDFYKAVYDGSRVPAGSITLPAGASGTGIAEVKQAEYEKIIGRFAAVDNVSVDYDTSDITVDTEDEVESKLPKRATAAYSDGSQAVLGIKWDTDSIDMHKAGEYTVTGEITTYVNPLAEKRADPQIKYDDAEDCYYMTASYPAFGSVTSGYDRIALRKADTISGLADVNGGVEKEVVIWQAPKNGDMSRHVWAPELQKINGKWYVFFAAGNESDVWEIRPYVLVCQDSSDPYNPENWKKSDGTYEIHMAQSKEAKYFKNMSLDMTYFEHNGKHYVIWADIIGQSALYMQEINPDNPWEGTSDKVIMLTTPEFGWERDSERVNEGPTILKHDGKIFCAFSASGTGPEYCIGVVYADDNADLMDEASWTKMGYPLLTSEDVPGEYGPGHNCFTVDEDGNPVFVYHARSQNCYDKKCGYSSNPLYDPCRDARVKNVHWTPDGLPILKMSAEEECPANMRSVSVKVKVNNDSKMDLGNAVISGYESYYDYAGGAVRPEITVSYKGEELVKDADYTVEYGSNNAIGKGTIKITAVPGGGCIGENQAEFDILEAPKVKVDYDMSVQDGKLVNKVNDNYAASFTGLTGDDFINGDGVGMLKLTGNGYVSLPGGVIDDNTFTVSVVAATTKANNQWLWAIGKDSWAYAFFTPANGSSSTKFAVTQEEPASNRTGAYGSEKTISSGSVGRDGTLHLYTVVVNGTQTAMYVDGQKVGSGENPFDIAGFVKDLGVTGYIGKSLYQNDPLFDGLVGEFRIYDNALSDGQVAKEAKSINLDSYIDMYAVKQMLNGNSGLDNITSNIVLPDKIAGKTITWDIPAGQEVIDGDGNVLRPVDGSDAEVTVKATWDGADGKTVTKEYVCTVKNLSVEHFLDDVNLHYGTQEGTEVYGNITLPTEKENGMAVTWSCDHPEIIDVLSHENTGYDTTPPGTVHRPAEDTVVKLTAAVTIGGVTGTREYTVTVKAAPEVIKEEDYTDYFFAYFTGEGKADGEQIYFASSEDGLNWTDLNDGNPSLTSSLGEKGLRDPYIIRSYEGDKFYIIATDLKIYGGSGWTAAQQSGSQALMVWESTDLVNWSNQRMITVSASIGAGCTWAPEATYDVRTGEYIVYWASKTASDNYGKQRLYYCKTRDFYTFTEPKLYIDYDQSSIDTTIIEHNGTYYRYTKNEGGSPNQFGSESKTIFIEKSDSVLGTYTHIASDSLNNENRGVEGPTIFKFNMDDASVDTWCLLVDNYGKGGYYPLITTDLESGVFKRPESGTYKMPTDARHGTPIRITREEYCRVMHIPCPPNVTPVPTAEPTAEPTLEPTAGPTAEPTAKPTPKPTAEPTAKPTAEPTAAPTAEPTAAPTAEPTAAPTAEPTATPTAKPTATPTVKPTATPTAKPTATPTAKPTATPTAEPTAAPTAKPTATSTATPTAEPTATADPTTKPTAEPTATADPTTKPTAEPTATPEPNATTDPTATADPDAAQNPTASPSPAPATNPAGDTAQNSGPAVGTNDSSATETTPGDNAATTAKTIKKLKVSFLSNRNIIKVLTMKKAKIVVYVYSSKDNAVKGKAAGRLRKYTVQASKNKKGNVRIRLKRKLKMTQAVRVVVSAKGYKSRTAVKS